MCKGPPVTGKSMSRWREEKRASGTLPRIESRETEREKARRCKSGLGLDKETKIKISIPAHHNEVQYGAGVKKKYPVKAPFNFS